MFDDQMPGPSTDDKREMSGIVHHHASSSPTDTSKHGRQIELYLLAPPLPFDSHDRTPFKRGRQMRPWRSNNDDDRRNSQNPIKPIPGDCPAPLHAPLPHKPSREQQPKEQLRKKEWMDGWMMTFETPDRLANHSNLFGIYHFQSISVS